MPAAYPRTAAMSEAVIRWIGGPVLHARTKGEFRIGEAIEVGVDRQPGEVIRLKGDELVGQVYEDTTGLRPGDAVHGSGSALSVRLGPRLLGHIFDGLLRPLEAPTAARRRANRLSSAGEGRRHAGSRVRHSANCRAMACGNNACCRRVSAARSRAS